MERYRTIAEAYFDTHVILELEREVGLVVSELTKELIKEIEKRSAEEIALWEQQRRNQQVIAAGTPDERIETESMAAEAIGDYRKPIPVRKAVFAEPATIYTVYGQITAMNRSVHKINGGVYQCSNCHGLQYIQYEIPSDVGDVEAPDVMHRMCRFCEELNLAEDSQDYRRAMQLRLRDPKTVNSRKIEITDAEEFEQPIFDEYDNGRT